MNEKFRAVSITLGILLLISVTANIALYKRGEQYYLQLNASHLDPLGLSAFPESPVRLRPPLILFFGDSRAAQWPTLEQVKDTTFVNRGIGKFGWYGLSSV